MGMVDDRDDLNISKLKDMAIDAECDGDFDRALQLWEQVNLSATKPDDRRRSLNKVRDLMSRVNPVVKPIVPEVQTTSEVPRSPLKSGSWSVEGAVIDLQPFQEDLGNGVFMDMVPIPGGTFQEAKVEPFFMSKTLITQAQWNAVVLSKTIKKVKIDLPENPSLFRTGPKRPVERVNWWQAEEFCARLTNGTSHNYRLPSEVQWEYACRSGTKTMFYFGEELTKEVANFGNSVRETTDVEKYPANAWGLYDMHGNVWEWCADHWRNKLKTPLKSSNPYLSSNSDADRVMRGGSWILAPSRCGSAFRLAGSPSFGSFFDFGPVGLRLVCSWSSE
jgi:hypothetical protein